MSKNISIFIYKLKSCAHEAENVCVCVYVSVCKCINVKKIKVSLRWF